MLLQTSANIAINSYLSSISFFKSSSNNSKREYAAKQVKQGENELYSMLENKELPAHIKQRAEKALSINVNGIV